MAGGVNSLANLQGKVDSNNRLEVAGTLSVGGAADGDAFGVGTQAVTPVGGFRDDTAPATVTEGNIGGARITEYRALHVNLRDVNGDEVAVGGGTQYAQGTASTDTDTLTMVGVERRDTPANPTGVADGDRTTPSVDSEGVLWTRARQQIDGDSGAGSVPTDIVIAGIAGSGGPISLIGGAGAVSAQVQRMTLASDDPAVASLAILDNIVSGSEAQVDVVTSALPTGASTLAEQQTQTASLSVIDDWDESDRAKVNPIVGQAGVQGASGVITALTQRVVLATDQPAIPTVTTVTTVSTLTGGGIAHDSADSGNPHKIGAKAYSPDGTTPGTAVAEGDRTDLKADLDGRLLVSASHPRSLHKHIDGSSALTDSEVAAAPGAGLQIIITNIIVGSNAATAMNFFLEEGATKIFGPYGLEAVAGRGFASGPIRLPVTANTAVTITTSAAIAHAVDIDYYIQAV